MSSIVLASLVSAALAAVLFIWWKKIGKAHALHDAAAAGNLDRIKTLIFSGSAVDGIYQQVSPLHVAVIKNQVDTAAFLISHGASVNLKMNTDNPLTALHIAAQAGNRDMVDLLLANAADVHAKASNFETPLLTAARSGHNDVFASLLSKGASLESKDASGNTMLFTCIMNDEPEAVNMLLEAGMDPNAQDPDTGACALHAAMIFALHSEKTDAIKYLLAHGADPEIPDQHGMTPTKMAAISKKETMIDLLKTYSEQK